MEERFRRQEELIQNLIQSQQYIIDDIDNYLKICNLSNFKYCLTA
jgi:hypothetical protein